MLIFFILVLIVIGVAVIGLAAWNRRLRDKRRKELAEWARLNEFSFLPAEDYSIGFRYQFFKCLQRGDNRYGYNIMEGISGKRVVCAFDYHYETHSSDSKGNRQTHHHHFSAVVVEAGLPLKPLFIRPEGFLDKVTEFVGFEDIDFESAEFSKRFFVKSPDRRWAYDVLHQATMELMLCYPRFIIDFQVSQVMAYWDNKTFSLGDFGSALKVVTGILDGLPDSVVRELKGIRSGGQPS
jgi:hypothetical protein